MAHQGANCADKGGEREADLRKRNLKCSQETCYKMQCTSQGSLIYSKVGVLLIGYPQPDHTTSPSANLVSEMDCFQLQF